MGTSRSGTQLVSTLSLPLSAEVRTAAGRGLLGGKWTRLRGMSWQPEYSQYLSNRVGHSIGTEVHGNGANIDNFESRDEREIIPNTCFSIKPGICLPEFGLRSEVNVLIRRGSAEVTGRIQREPVLI
jgi:Metallopeptidase family M24